MIEVSVPDGDEKVIILKFRKMDAVQAVDWASRVKARTSFHELLVKERDEMRKVPAGEVDMTQLLKMEDGVIELETQMANMSKGLVSYIMDPGQKEVDELYDRNPAGIALAIQEFLDKTLPSEEDQKKS